MNMANRTNTTGTFNGNIDLSALRKKRFTLDNDESRVLELDTADLSIIQRLSEAYPKLEDLEKEVSQLTTGVEATEESVKDDITIMASRLRDVDSKMRNVIDYIFDSNVSEMCAPTGSMYDPIGGQLRYEHLISILIGLYEENLAVEMKRVQKRVKSHTAKYTG
jgi:hypothetical protein